MKKILICILVLCTLLFSCKNKTEELVTPEGYSATITIGEPEIGAVFASGDELHVEVEFTNDPTIQPIAVYAINTTNGDTIINV